MPKTRNLTTGKYSDTPKVPVVDRTPAEAHRKCSTAVNQLLNRMSVAEDSIVELQSLITEMTISGYGAVQLATSIPNFNLPADTWVTMPFDAETLTNARGVTFDTASNTFQFSSAGVWRLSVGFGLQGHNSSNGGRAIRIRLFNVTTGIGSSGTVVGVGRNVEDTSTNASVVAEALANTYRVEIGNGDAITGGELITTSIGLNYLDRLATLPSQE